MTFRELLYELGSTSLSVTTIAVHFMHTPPPRPFRSLQVNIGCLFARVSDKTNLTALPVGVTHQFASKVDGGSDACEVEGDHMDLMSR